MNGVRFRGVIFGGQENEGRLAWYDGVEIGLYDGLHYSAGSCFFQDCTPHGLGLEWTGKVRCLYPHKNHE